MLSIPWMVSLGDHGISKLTFETSIFELPRVKNRMSNLATHTVGPPPPPADITSNRVKKGEKHGKYGLKHALHNLDGRLR